ncbi:sugar ABC transporter substrate-binding protein [Brevibacillus brevis]|uniref:Sugar ABC transporter substrate-binding protein n=1 Tax=Brevibacillus brevis TaxID=1393 RepID=A0A2Z4MF79_BREBE|nr:sugar ABC transporter substrate-binding protein [Brevibacillus brevis]AWX55182.1 sugar ABC transporter substrate-binding protein [Brevibacillus brevis]
MKKLVSIAMAALLVAVAGCSGGGQSSAPAGTTDSAASGEKVTLTYALWDKNQMPAIEEMAKKFNEKNPNVDIKIELTPNKQYWTKMEAAATGGTLPDIFWINGPRIIKYADNDMLLPITDQIKADGIDLNNYPKALVDLYTYDGQNYALPKDFDTIGLWYNKKLFDDAKVPYPDETWDWNKLKEVAKQLTDEKKGVWGIAAPPYGQDGFYNTIYQNGGYIISEDKKTSGYDKPETIEGLKFWTDLISEKASPTAAQLSETEATQLFESGKIAMMYNGSWMASAFHKNEYTKDKVDVTYLPKGKENTSVIHGLGNVISANTKHPKEAWEFVKFLGSKEGAEILAKSGAAIPAFNGTQDTWVQSMPNFQLKIFIDQAAAAKPYPISKDTAKWAKLETELMTKAWAGQMSVEDASKELAQKMNEMLSQE